MPLPRLGTYMLDAWVLGFGYLTFLSCGTASPEQTPPLERDSGARSCRMAVSVGAARAAGGGGGSHRQAGHWEKGRSPQLGKA